MAKGGPFARVYMKLRHADQRPRGYFYKVLLNTELAAAAEDGSGVDCFSAGCHLLA